MPVGDAPHGLALSQDLRQFYAANHEEDTISVVDMGSLNVLQTLAGMDSPNGLAFNPDATLLCAAHRNTDSVTCVHMGLLPMRWTRPVGHLPNGLAYNPSNGHLYVANYGSGDVTVLDGSVGTELTTIPVGDEPAMVAVNPSTNKVYVTLHSDHRLAVIDGASDTLSKRVDLGTGGSYGVAVDELRNLVYVATIDSHRIVVVDGATDTLLGWVEVKRSDGTPVSLRMIGVNPNLGTSGHVYVTSSAADPNGVDRLLVFPKGWPEGFARPYALDVGALPREGLIVNLASDRVYVSARGDDQVTVVGDGEPVCLPNFAAAAYSIEVKRAETGR